MIGEYPETFRAELNNELIELFFDYLLKIITLNAYNGMIFEMYQDYELKRCGIFILRRPHEAI